jgi:hypothetical protein
MRIRVNVTKPSIHPQGLTPAPAQLRTATPPTAASSLSGSRRLRYTDLPYEVYMTAPQK